MRVKQQDIARLAKVSQATVSRVLAGDDRVEASIRDRVACVMKELNYQPDVRARSLRTRKTGLLGLVIKRPYGGLSDDPFFGVLTAGILDFLSGRPYHLCLDIATDDFAQSHIYDEMLRTRRVDGLILVESESRDDRIIRLHEDHFPFVLIGNPHNSQVSSVDNDNVYAGVLATAHLVENGYKNIGFLGGYSGLTVSDDRIDGYRSVMKQNGRDARVWRAEFGIESAQYEAQKILALEDRPDALVVLDDYMAFGVVLAARSMGIAIPDDLGLVGFNDSRLCSLLDGGLTSVSLNIHQIVDRALTKLLHIVEETEEVYAVREVIPCELIARGSSVRKGGG